MKYKLLIAFLMLALSVPLAASAALVPCGGGGQQPCTFQDLLALVITVINYLIGISSLVAMYHVVLAGWIMITALGNPEQIEKGKKTITEAVVGFAIVILAFMFINLLVNGIFGKVGAERRWWDPQCIFLNQSGCPLGAGDVKLKP